MLNLAQSYQDLITKILTKYIPHYTVWVYGSRIKGTAHEGSDLDLVILDQDNEISEEQLLNLRTAFSDSNIPITVDILLWSALPDSYKKEINSAHEIFK